MSEAPVQEISARAFVPVLSTDEIEKIPFIIKNVIENVNFIEDLSVIQSVANYKGLSIPLYESIRKFCSIARITPESAIVIATKANISEYFSSISTLIRIINNSLKSTSNTHSYIPNSLESIVNNCKSILKVLNVNLYNPLTLTALQEYKILAYQKYKANASKADLDNMPILNKIKSKIEYLGSRISLTSDVERKDEFPFIAVIGPSFMGKTQLAFTLARTHPVLYFNFIVGESRQSVYKVFERISSELESCLSDDLKKVNGRDNFGAALSVIMHYLNKNIRYKSLSFIYALLERAAAFDFNDPNAEWMDFYLECGPLAYSEMTFAEYYQKIKVLNFTTQPVLFIDEFFKNENIIFLRNLSRAMKLPSICSSTNSKVSNMISLVNDGSGSVYSDWCDVYHFLDSASLDGIAEALSLPREISNNESAGGTELDKKECVNESLAEELLFFTVDTYALTLPGIDGPKLCEGSASLAINKHYYYFGSRSTRNDPIILKIAKDRIYEEGVGLFKTKSYFSSFCEDVLIHVALWSLLNSESLDQQITVAQVVKSFYDREFKWINVNDIANDYRPQEYLANAAIAHASHQNIYGETDGVTFLKEFAIQVQIVPEPYGTQLRNMIPDCPEKLNAFLMGLKIPYFIPQKPVDPSDPDMGAIKALKGLMKIGQSCRLNNKDGFDVAFDLNESGLVQGRIECKNLQNTVAKGFVKKYVIRAMEKRVPLTFFLIRKAAPSLRSKELFGGFKEANVEPRTLTGDKITDSLPLIQLPIESIKNPRESETSFDASGEYSFSDLIAAEAFQDPDFGDFRINVYSLVREENYDNLVFKTLYEDPSAQGHFVIIESNCNLSSDVRRTLSRFRDDQKQQQQKNKKKKGAYISKGTTAKNTKTK